MTDVEGEKIDPVVRIQQLKAKAGGGEEWTSEETTFMAESAKQLVGGLRYVDDDAQ